jgi:hypothetical protein
MRTAIASGFRDHGTWPSHGRTPAEIAAQVNRELQSLGATLESTAHVVETRRAHG